MGAGTGLGGAHLPRRLRPISTAVAATATSANRHQRPLWRSDSETSRAHRPRADRPLRQHRLAPGRGRRRAIHLRRRPIRFACKPAARRFELASECALRAPFRCVRFTVVHPARILSAATPPAPLEEASSQRRLPEKPRHPGLYQSGENMNFGKVARNLLYGWHIGEKRLPFALTFHRTKKGSSI